MKWWGLWDIIVVTSRAFLNAIDVYSMGHGCCVLRHCQWGRYFLFNSTISLLRLPKINVSSSKVF